MCRPRHWAALGRPFYAVGALAGLRSWSGSMFEYLMPTLVLDEPHGSVLHDAAHAAVREQIAFARGAPRALGHLRVGLRRQRPHAGLPVRAAGRAAAGAAPHAARRTGDRALRHRAGGAGRAAPRRRQPAPRSRRSAARGRYGFIEALDFTPARQSRHRRRSPASSTFMAHHQGMSIVAIANVLLDRARAPLGHGRSRASRRWRRCCTSARRARCRCCASRRRLAARRPRKRRAPACCATSLPGMAAIEPTHLLSNGRYAVALRANGAGCEPLRQRTASRAGATTPCATRYGSFFYLRWDRQPRAGLADPASGARPGRALSRAASTPTGSCFERRLARAGGDDHGLGQPRRRHRVPPASNCTTTATRTLDLELIVVFEVALADPRADEAHPAFRTCSCGAEWQAGHQALVFERKPRLATDEGAARGALPGRGRAGADRRCGVQVDRQRWLGRNRDASHPLAAFDEPPVAPSGDGAPLDTGLDPVARVRGAPADRARRQGAPDLLHRRRRQRATLRAVIDKYRQPSHVERASLMSATLAGIRLREHAHRRRELRRDPDPHDRCWR